MPILENQRHEAVAQAYVLDPHKNGGKAYAFVYPKVSPRGAEVCFGRLLQNVAFSNRIAELQASVAKEVEITLESLLSEAEQHRVAAFGDKEYAAANGALKLKSELSGHYVQRKETTVKRDATDYSTDELVAWLNGLQANLEDQENIDAGSVH